MNFSWVPLSVAFGRARRAAQRHMTRMEDLGLTWGEESVTELVLRHAAPRVAVYPFNKKEEGGRSGTGADWLWWWIDGDGTAFGMLVQAKRLKKKDTGAASWDIDFAYKSGRQRSQLLATAEKLQVAATYVLYFGSTSYTGDIQPPGDDPHLTHWLSSHPREWCPRCKRKTVAFLSAEVARDYTSKDAAQAYVRSTPIENLADPRSYLQPLTVVPTVALPVKLKAFVEHQQHGSKNVAKNFLAQTLDQRLGQYALGTAEQVKASPNIEATEAPFFETFPDDRDHSGVQYFPAVLRGLRSAPPAYVLNLLNGEGLHIPDEFRLSGEELAGIDGVVVVNVGDPEVESETL